MNTAALPLSVANNPRPDQWIGFNAQDRSVRLSVGKVEIGQGILTALAQIAAEELDVGFDRIRIVAGDTERAPDEGSTSSSLSIEVSGASVRLISAEVRSRVLDRLAQRLNCAPEDISVVDGAFSAVRRRPDLITGPSRRLQIWRARRMARRRANPSPTTSWSARRRGGSTCRAS